MDDEPAVQTSHNALVAAAEVEIAAPPHSLFWSAVGAGLAIAFSFLAASGARAAAPPGWEHVLGALAYPLGFAIVVMGRYQLFTENTLPPVALVLERLAPVSCLGRVWGLVLLGNLLGASAVGGFLAWPGLLTPGVAEAAVHVASVVHAPDPGVVFGRAVIAGWLVAAMVWLVHRVDRGAGLAVIWVCASLMPLLHLEHVVVGTVEAMWALASGLAPLGAVAVHLGVTLIGNTLGGVLLVALLNHARTDRVQPDRPRLPARAWLLG